MAPRSLEGTGAGRSVSLLVKRQVDRRGRHDLYIPIHGHIGHTYTQGRGNPRVSKLPYINRADASRRREVSNCTSGGV